MTFVLKLDEPTSGLEICEDEVRVFVLTLMLVITIRDSANVGHRASGGRF